MRYPIDDGLVLAVGGVYLLACAV